MMSPVTEFNTYLKSIPDINVIEYLHKTLGVKGVRVVFEKETYGNNDENPVYKRLMFGTFNRSCNFDFPGVIMGFTDGKFKAISVPPPPPLTKYNSRKLAGSLKNKSDIIEANDGTTVTLYYLDKKWVISTHRGFEVNSYKWIKQKTYQEAVDEVLKTYPNFSYDKLDKNKCYTIGFNHSEFHPFRESDVETDSPIFRAWFIQSVDLVKFNSSDSSYISYDEDIGLPIQKIIKFDNIKTMFQKANNAYSNYLKTGKINYGYLVRVGFRQYLVESTLLRNIRRIFYSNRFNKLSSSFNKTRYITVNAFLDAKKHAEFKQLFPHYAKQFMVLERHIDTLVKNIIGMVESDGNVEPSTIPEVVAGELYDKITSEITLKNKKKITVTNIVYEYIYDTRFTNLLYKLAYPEDVNEGE